MTRSWLMTQPPRDTGTWVGVCALCLGLASTSACGPRASSVPLGLGPLAVAERDAQAQAEANRRKSKPKPTRRPAVAAAPAKEPLAKPEAPKADASAETAASQASSADASGAVAPARFEGMYAGDDIAVYRLTGSPELEQRDDKAKIRIEKGRDGNVSIALINSADGSDLCELVARVEGNAALIESAQPCFSGGEGSPEVELTSGRAVLEGDRLRMNAEGRLSVPDQELDGEMTYTFEGERQ
jgi:hypothetical protein